MRILLVNPPRSPHNGILAHASADVLPFIHKKLVGPPLGLLTIAGAVPDHDVRLLELKAEYDLPVAILTPDEAKTRTSALPFGTLRIELHSGGQPHYFYVMSVE